MQASNTVPQAAGAATEQDASFPSSSGVAEFLRAVQELCPLMGWEATLEPASDTSAIDKLKVRARSKHEDGESTQLDMDIWLAVIDSGNTYRTEEELEVAAEDPLRPATVEIILPLPIKIEPAFLPNVARLLSVLNLTTGIGHFCISESDAQAAHRYTWHAPVSAVTSVCLLALMQSCVEEVAQWRGLIEQVAAGSIRYEDLLSNAREAHAQASKASA